MCLPAQSNINKPYFYYFGEAFSNLSTSRLSVPKGRTSRVAISKDHGGSSMQQNSHLTGKTIKKKAIYDFWKFPKDIQQREKLSFKKIY